MSHLQVRQGFLEEGVQPCPREDVAGVHAAVARALAASAPGHWRLWGRDQADYCARYPELDVLGRLPTGIVVDGELVRLVHGLPDFEAVLTRHQLTRADKIRHASQIHPVSYVLFNVLYAAGREPWS
jgi:ATP-dependent DNA ligase